MNINTLTENLEEEPDISFKKSKKQSQRHESCPNYTILKEPKYCVIRTCFDVESDDYTEFEKRKQEYFIKNYTNSKAIEKKLQHVLLHNFINKKLMSSRVECYRFLNMFAYDIDTAIKNLVNYLDLLKTLNEEKIMQKLYDTITISQKTENLEEILYELGQDLKNRRIIGLDFSRNNRKIPSSNFFDDIINSLVSYLNNIFQRDSCKVNSEQIVIIINLDKLNQSILPQNFSCIIKLFEYMYPSRIHKMFFKCDPMILSHIEESLTEYNLEKILLIDLENIFSTKKTSSQDFDKNIIIDFIKNPAKFKFNRIILSPGDSISTRVKSTCHASFYKSNEVDTSNFFKFNGFEKNVIYNKNNYNEQSLVDRNGIDKRNFTINCLGNTEDVDTYSCIMKPVNFFNKLTIANAEQFNIINGVNGVYLSEKEENKKMSIYQNSFSLTSTNNLVEVKAQVRKRGKKLHMNIKNIMTIVI